MNRDCYGDRYTFCGWQYYRCAFDGTVIEATESEAPAAIDGDACPQCHRPIRATDRGKVETRESRKTEVLFGPPGAPGWRLHVSEQSDGDRAGELAYAKAGDSAAAESTSAMIAEACAALGIESAGDESERWAAVLEAIRAKRAASAALGWAVVDREGKVYRNVGGSTFYDAEDFAESMAGALDNLADGGGPLASRAPFRVVPIGPVAEQAPGAEFNTGLEAAARLVCPVGHEGERDCRQVADAIRALKTSPPDRPAEALEPKTGENESRGSRSPRGIGPSARRRRSWDRD